ncbi:cobalt/nickel transport system ATP-binding protein [Haloplanus vescus]|uniref:ABC transporter ATP-binding protein n=1 Tax=Haloplanus vescus TaxID=555874 RepID=A0A1H3YJV8_9EURY|nr:ABC transporter ATP-binding protein [Haloplanus vescus]SEA11228.1 cobalt/nickel transport system ATP-binding protein [Haloplanus vescus]
MIETVDLHFGYGDQSVLRGVDFTAQSAAVTVLLGRNGAGKSSLLKQFNGLLEPDRGHVEIGGERLEYDSDSLKAVRRRVGFVFQQPEDQLVAPTVEQDVAFGPHNMEGGEAESVSRTLERVGLAGYEDRLCSRLSNGERKRVALAGVLAMNPDYVVLDEPTAGLDGEGTRALVDLIRGLTDEGITFVVSTHYPGFASAVGDAFTVLDDGEIAYRGATLEGIDAERYGLRRFGV